MPTRSSILLSVHSARAAGAERMALAEAQYLKPWYDLVIAVPDGPLRTAFAAHGSLIPGTPSLPLWRAPARRWMMRAARTIRHAVRLARVIRERRIGLVLCNSSVSMAPVLAARLARVPVIVHAREVPESRLSPIVFALHSRLADTVIAISEANERQFHPGHRARVVRIPDGVDIPPMTGGGANGFHEPVRLCVIGTIDRRKSQHIAVEALGVLRDRGVDAVLELVGREADPAFAAEVRATADRLGVSGSLRFTGEVAAVDEVIDSSDIVLVSSIAEWTPLVLMEAQARRKPVVASRVGGIPEVVIDRESGVLTPPGDAAAIADAVEGLAADPAAARRMGARGREHVADQFDVRQSLEALRREVERALAPERTH